METPVEPTPTVERPTFVAPQVEEPVSYREEEPTEEPVVETPVREETEYRRHDYMDLFSTSNPNLFGRVEEEKEDEPIQEEREISRFSREEEPEFGRGRDIFDEPERDAYSLRNDFECRDVEPTSN